MQRQGYFQQPARLQDDCTRCREEQATSYSLSLTVSFPALKTMARCAELRRPCPAARFWPSLNAKPWGGCGLGHSLFISTHSAGYLVGVALPVRRTLQQDVQVTSSSQPFCLHALDSPTDRKDLQGMQWRQGHVQQPAFQPTRIGQAVPTDRKDSPTWQGML